MTPEPASMSAEPKSNPALSGSPSCSLEALKARAQLLARTRAFFDARAVLEVETPALSCAATTEPMLDSFKVSLPATAVDTSAPCWHLQTSPELMLKRLLCAGSGPIYEICRVYRAGEVGRRHNPEFSMLEWYHPQFSLDELMQEVDDYLRTVLAEHASSWPTVYYHYADLFIDILGVDPLASTPAELQVVAIKSGAIQPEDRLELSTDEWLDLLMTTIIEPALPHEQISFVCSYPASQAALAKLDPDDPRVAQRFEVYLMGMELANGYRELTDAEQQARRFEQELIRRAELGKEAVQADQRFIAAMRAGMPECAGVSIGLDRVLMIQTNVRSIADVLSFAWDNL